ncbi:LuxR C-terminal-related transcriptional regulator [Pseudonocardia yunnanensis]|uniref:LuxR C-terminal-related transcriptional regulator n=1 Tax=Pseudonocardia yunnanensis TaxID=58107 RepID=A0ABW4F4P3_9PSEU
MTPDGLRRVVVRTRLRPPVLQPDHVRRHRLLARLTAAREPIVLLRAPTGAGKTVLLAQWVGGLPDRSWCWVSLSRYDNHPAGVWSALLEALRPHYTATGPYPPSRLEDRATLLGEVVPDLVNGLIGAGPLTVIVDDLGGVDDPLALEALDSLARELPDEVRLALATARPLTLPSLPALQAAGRVAELDEAELRFTLAEAGTLLTALADRSLGEKTVRTVHEATDGLAVALRLTGVAVREAPQEPVGPAPVPAVVEYLRAGFLERVTSRQRRFLLHTSVLDVLTPDACAAVNGGRDGHVLEELARVSFLVRRSPTQVATYRYHPVLRAALATVLDVEEPGAAVLLHARAAAWFTAQGRLEPVLRHAAAAHDPGLAGHAVLARWAAAASGEVLGWLDGLVRDPRTAGPALRRVGAAAALARGAGSGAARWRMGPCPDGTEMGGADAALGAMEALHGGRLAEAYRLGSIATATGDADGPWWPGLGSLARGTALMWSGRLDEARAALRAAADIASATGYRYVLGRVQEALAACAFLAGADDDEIRRAVGEALSGARGDALAPLARCLLALTGAYRGDVDGLDDAITAARALDDGEPHAAAAAWCIVANLALLSGDGARAAHAGDLARAALADCEPGSLLEALLPAAPRPAVDVRDRGMSTRERAVLRALGGSLSLRQIAAELNLSHNTIKTHVRTIFRKLGVHDRGAAVAAARELGLLPPRGFRRGCSRPRR